MMSQNRQQGIDRKAAENDYRINVKAELKIDLLHEKIDQPREREILKLTEDISHFHSPRGILCFDGTVLIQRTTT